MSIPNGWIYGDCGCCCESTVAVEDDCDCPPSGGGTAVGNEVLIVNLVADMAAVVPYDGLKQFNVGGLSIFGDGLGGFWTYLPSSSAPSDGYSVLTPPGGVGRYIKWT